ncbi:F510_1955 family glycosylhydrolase [uncultured Phycicoccus sp.]|uniref:F510_1955 family glycosylhydrolase n=1 Tax=uncultured Phycicoccus sp. TaxID=661422 RepID=UPI002622A690|nr:hypothetical protein [uncultured Phycicoccus sp.]
MRRLLTALVATGSALLLAACGTDPTAASAGADGGPDRPMGHIHGIAVDPDAGHVVVAAHGGLYVVGDDGPTPVGPSIDLMGFTIGADGAYLASGHPGPGTDLDQPVGLVRSTDGGRTWAAVSRGGESDFHGLTAAEGLVAGFDGELRVSADGREWETRAVPSAPHVLAAAPSGARLLATTADGLLATDDRGASWRTVDTPELLVAVDWADDDTVVGVGLTGRIVVSEDAGATWASGPRELGELSAVHAHRDGTSLVVLVVADEGVLRTTDQGATSTRLW